MKIIVQTVTFGSPEYDEVVDLRYQVLRRPLGIEYVLEDLALEYKDVHFAAYTPDYELVGALLLNPKGETAQMRQAAVHPNYQKKGVGHALVAAFETYAKQAGFERIQLAARATAIPFYEKLGYHCVSDTYACVGLPHKDMEKKL